MRKEEGKREGDKGREIEMEIEMEIEAERLTVECVGGRQRYRLL